jgi:2-oxoglutarate ferredoxin oxidoreductase subunit beta
VREHVAMGEIVTGLLYIDASQGDMHEVAGTVDTPLNQVEYEKLNPGKQTLGKILAGYR